MKFRSARPLVRETLSTLLNPRNFIEMETPSLTNATILVVEDEQQVRTLIARLLEKRGYRVLQAENGRKALEMIRDSVGDLSLVVTDLVMPEMGGEALMRELGKLRNDLPVLCMTGYTQEEVTSLAGLSSTNIIEKPFSPAAFLERVQAILNEGASSSS
jgi:two-component system cell cycle sensor histidine kinase/response regulator CckA